MNHESHVKCPRCKNKRLFDVEGELKGTIKIKCPTCRNVVEINLNNIQLIHTEQNRACIK